jgi:hypothetical protein
MANQPQSNRYQRAETAGGEPSMTIKEFCRSERISRSLFYIMQKEGWGPRLMYVGTSVRISGQARRDWQREREAAAAAGIRRGTPHKLSPTMCVAPRRFKRPA